MPDPLARRFGQYELLERLGRGGMGETWKARRAGVRDAPTVVIKRMLEDLAGDPKQVEAFVNEAHLTATLKHPNIAEVLDFGQAQGEYFFALELVHGCTVDALLHAAESKGLKTLPVPVACYLAASVLAGLDHAHTRTGPDGQPLKLVHRDISPDNVLVGFDGQVKIIDFGVAKARLPRRTETQVGRVKGKIHYFSPEQARAEPLDGRSDVFAVGVMLYRLACGQLPFEGAGMEVAYRMLKGDYAPPHVANPALPTPLVNAINRALEVSRERRFQTAALMETALRQVLTAVAPRFGQSNLRSFVHWAFSESLEAEGVTTEIAPVDRAQIARWVDESSSAKRLPGFTPADPRTRGATELATSGLGRARPRPASRWLLALGALALFGLGVGVASAVALREEQPAPAPQLPPRVLALARAYAAYQDLEKLGAIIPSDIARELERLRRDQLGTGATDAEYLDACARLEAKLRTAIADFQTATRLAAEREALELAAEREAAAKAADAGPPAPIIDVVTLERGAQRRVRLSTGRHSLSSLAFRLGQHQKWRGKYPEPVSVNLPGGAAFAQVAVEPYNSERKSIFAIQRKSGPEILDVVGVRLIDFRPLEEADPAAPVPEAQVIAGLRGTNRVRAVRIDRGVGGFVELKLPAGLRSIAFERAGSPKDETWDAVAHCDGKTQGVGAGAARFAAPRRCALALVGNEKAPESPEVVVSLEEPPGSRP